MGWHLVLCPRHNDDSPAAPWQVEVFLELPEAVGSDQLRIEDRSLAGGFIHVIIHPGVRWEGPLEEEGYKVSSFLEDE